MKRLALSLLVVVSACSDDGEGSGRDLAGRDLDVERLDLGGGDGPAGNADLAQPKLGCIETKAWCSQWNERTYCEDTAQGAVWKKETCAAGCFQGACSASACADECSIGDTSNLGTCKLWNMGTQAYVGIDQTLLVDRARQHDRQTQLVTKTALGAMMQAAYSDATHSTLQYYWGTGDAAIWSGSYLAAEAWRLIATGSRDAADQVAAKVRMLHDWFKVTGDTGYVARLALPRDAAVPLEFNWQGQNYCADKYKHCNVDYKGSKWDWVGGLSRDQYTGVMLGLGMAYLASPDEEVRKLAREDVTTVALELTKTRMIPMTVTIDGVPLSTTVTLDNVILAPSEYENGKVAITLSTSNISTGEDSGISGMREFLPDFSTFVKQVIPFLGAVPIPRASTAMMLGGFFNIAMRAAKDVPGYESVYTTLRTYYDAHFDDWYDKASLWTYDGGCNAKYYPNHIAYIMAYAWALLEEDPLRKNQLSNAVVDDRLWDALREHKNSYFDYLWGGTRNALVPVDQARIDAANAQLAGFMHAPKIRVAFDHTAKYPNDAMCMTGGGPASTVAVDVADRRMDDSIWQRGAWQLVEGGDPNTLFPATDYLGAYWAARRHGLIADDRVGTCTRWSP
jgi:hypothetical protein